jgi:hypothetical protein
VRFAILFRPHLRQYLADLHLDLDSVVSLPADLRQGDRITLLKSGIEALALIVVEREFILSLTTPEQHHCVVTLDWYINPTAPAANRSSA